LLASVFEAGGVPVRLGIAPDAPDALTEAVSRGLDADVFLSSGGVSAGDYDFLPRVLQEVGVAVHFHKVAIKPGKPVLFGTRGGPWSSDCRATRWRVWWPSSSSCAQPCDGYRAETTYCGRL
jgi:molybdopterin biosynthesis enzyme